MTTSESDKALADAIKAAFQRYLERASRRSS